MKLVGRMKLYGLMLQAHKSDPLDLSLAQALNRVRSGIAKGLDDDEIRKYSGKGYRLRYVKYAVSKHQSVSAKVYISTWRPHQPIVEDRPLAVCDYFSVAVDDKVSVDRVFPDTTFEMYFMKYNPHQRWHWLSKHSSSELMLMMTYDSHAGDGAKCTFGVPLSLANAIC